MKANKRQDFSKFVPLPLGTELTHADKKAIATAAHGSDPTHRFHVNAAGHDLRPTVAASGSPQRMRARQGEAR